MEKCFRWQDQIVARELCLSHHAASTFVITGVPPHVMIMVEMEELKNVLKYQRNQISADLRGELNKRHIGGDAFKASGIL